MKVLIACEESQRVCIAFREKGHEAYSCDMQECSGGHPEWHIRGDCLPIINGEREFITQDGQKHCVFLWDMLIAHPPCTYLTVTGNRWFNKEKFGGKAIQREIARSAAAAFFMQFANAPIPRIAIENPVGVMSRIWRKPDQIIQPYMFGEPYEKKTCLWLSNLPPLKATNIVEPPERVKYASGKTMPKWYADLWHLSPAERAKERSKTFWGIARAMAEQWGNAYGVEVDDDLRT